MLRKATLTTPLVDFPRTRAADSPNTYGAAYMWEMRAAQQSQLQRNSVELRFKNRRLEPWPNTRQIQGK